MKASRRMWIVVQLDEPGLRNVVYETIAQVVQEMCGHVLKSGGFGDVVVLARFPHRKYRTVEEAIAKRLAALPVKRLIVVRQDPFVLRERSSTLTMELYRRQDEVVGLSAQPKPK